MEEFREPFKRLNIQTEGMDVPITGYKYEESRLGERGTEHVEGSYEYYSLDYPIECSAADFLKAFEQVLAPMVRANEPEKPPQMDFEKNPDHASKLWEHGVIVYVNENTDIKLHGAPLQPHLETRDWDALQPEALQRMLKTRLEIDKVFDIEAIRLNTWQGDFQFELVPEEDDPERHISIISHRNLAPQIAALYELTRTRDVSRDELEKALQQELQEFKVPVTA